MLTNHGSPGPATAHPQVRQHARDDTKQAGRFPATGRDWQHEPEEKQPELQPGDQGESYLPAHDDVDCIATDRIWQKTIASRDSSPFSENSSFLSDKPGATATRDSGASSHLAAKDRMSPVRLDENYNPDRSPSPSVSSLPLKRRISIERLKQASRVKNSNIFALESKDAYDPASLPVVERPTTNRPLSQQFANNNFTRFDSLRKENNPLTSPQRPAAHKRSETEIHVPKLSPTKDAAGIALPLSPEKQASPSPTKSSMARTSMFDVSSTSLLDQDHGTWSDDERGATPRGLHRHNKSVTFHADPPVVNEYEQQTPEPSVSVGSRESSWDSDELDQQDYSFERGSSVEQDREDSFDEDLENAEKTPVVLPEDWSRMSPEEARTDLVNRDDDVFDSPSPSRPETLRSASIASDGSSRPLPPLPALLSGAKQRRGSSNSLSAAAERASQGSRSLPSPLQPAMVTKDSIARMARESALSFQDRLKLLSARSPSRSPEHAPPRELTITNLDTGEKLDVHVRQTEVEEDSVCADLEGFASPPRISRESILRKVRNSKYDFEDESDGEADAEESMLERPDSRPTYAELAQIDPDTAIPSRENSRETSEVYLQYGLAASHLVENHEDVSVLIKPEPVEDEQGDMNAIPDFAAAQFPPRSPTRMGDHDEEERQSSVLHHRMASESEDESRYSDLDEAPEVESTLLHHHSITASEPQQQRLEEEEEGKETLDAAMQLLTVKDYTEPAPRAADPVAEMSPSKRGGRQSFGLPSYEIGGGDEYDFGLSSFITPSPPNSSDGTAKPLDITASAPNLPAQPTKSVFELQHPSSSYREPQISPPGTPDSVIQHRTSEVSQLSEPFDLHLDPVSDADVDALGDTLPEPEPLAQVEIPERRSTIKTSGKLKARPSMSRAELEAIGFGVGERRVASGDAEAVPAIPAQYRPAELKNQEGGEERPTSSTLASSSGSTTLLDLNIPTSSEADDLTIGLENEFNRVIESQQKGYLTRQNTKIVVASNRSFSNETSGSDASSTATATPMSPTAEATPRPQPRAARKGAAATSPRKASAEQYLKTEPWNGKARRKSVRNASAQRTAGLPAPPLPGQESALDAVAEDYSTLDDEVAEGTERGRLFVKVVGVKGLDLPLPRNDRVDFQLTLDNGLHCVTTSNLELGSSAAIGQEFELVVQEDLEFQLTLTTKLPPRRREAAAVTPSSTAAAPMSPGKKSGGFASRLLSSPKKRAAERERAERELAAQRAREAEVARKRVSAPPSPWDLLHDLVDASSGSFARAYINLKSHESGCFGRPLSVDVPCYNEWALEKDSQVVNSVRSKRGTHAAGPVRRPPYVIGKLEVVLLYVPRPRGGREEEMPKSMSSAVREMKKAAEVKEVVYEGCLSQQGGDCQVSFQPAEDAR